MKLFLKVFGWSLLFIPFFWVMNVIFDLWLDTSWSGEDTYGYNPVLSAVLALLLFSGGVTFLIKLVQHLESTNPFKEGWIKGFMAGSNSSREEAEATYETN